MTGTEFCDMLNSFPDIFHRFHRHFIVEKFSSETFSIGRFQQIFGVIAGQNLISVFVGINDNIFLCHFPANLRKVCQSFLIDYQTVEGITHAYTACFCIENDVYSLFQITVFIKISVTHAGSGFNYRNQRILSYKVN